jgi:phosphoribosylglycinamide formyltransferase-1
MLINDHIRKMKSSVVLVSGNGSNLQRIIDCIESGEILNTNISVVIADRDCFGLERAKKHNIPTIVISRGKNFSSELKNALPKNTDLIILAGFLSILSEEFCETFSGKIINIHPALLPKFGGKGMWGNHVHEAVLAAKENESGATVHYVTFGIDEGKIILQKSFLITKNETIETLAQKVHEIEFEIFPKAINLVLNNY